MKKPISDGILQDPPFSPPSHLLRSVSNLVECTLVPRGKTLQTEAFKGIDGNSWCCQKRASGTPGLRFNICKSPFRKMIEPIIRDKQSLEWCITRPPPSRFTPILVVRWRTEDRNGVDDEKFFFFFFVHQNWHANFSVKHDAFSERVW